MMLSLVTVILIVTFVSSISFGVASFSCGTFSVSWSIPLQANPSTFSTAAVTVSMVVVT